MRCSNLIDVCEAHVQFGRRDAAGGVMEAPTFSGTHGPEIQKKLAGIEDQFQASSFFFLFVCLL